MPEQKTLDEVRLEKAESWVKIHQICQMMETIWMLSVYMMLN